MKKTNTNNNFESNCKIVLARDPQQSAARILKGKGGKDPKSSMAAS